MSKYRMLARRVAKLEQRDKNIMFYHNLNGDIVPEDIPDDAFIFRFNLGEESGNHENNYLEAKPYRPTEEFIKGNIYE